jgi:thymidine kinase
MPALMAVAEFVTKVHAVCAVCGSIASYSYRLLPVKEKILLGETESYEARCRRCFNLGPKAGSPAAAPR